MPRFTAPPPSDEFTIRLTKPFSGVPTREVEVIGEPNREASIRTRHTGGSNTLLEMKGDVPKDDVNELMSLISALRGFPSDASKDIFGFDTRLEFNTFEIQYANDQEDNSANVDSEVGQETKDEFKRVADSIEALGRQFAKQDSAI